MSGDLGAFVRAWRERVSPSVVGFPDDGRRRTAGLRREELATVAGLSMDYLVRLEQGRATNPSPEILEALARALQLREDERDHLFHLAGKEPPAPRRMTAEVTPGVRRIVERLAGHAAGIFDGAWNLLEWNATWAALMGDPAAREGRLRNVAWAHFVGPGVRVLRDPGTAERFERALVADLQVVAGRFPHDDNVQSLVTDLRAASPRFADLWDARQVDVHQSDHKIIDHPEAGPISLECDVLTVDSRDLRVVVYTADPASPDAAALARISASAGTDALTYSVA